ncbi:HK97 family phage prohead protease [uncultured Bacteroides sp.]|uniref:HK97 family phage prohead protease n=1 Tax=uncultured Bacteroides sp. TaxID=162156 RepID=UPI00207069FD|nr:HK97 family phage prohead protease [uncultured Bacteroides sp.]DAJ86851.1 MAG TPA: prohead serine protease [Caudoviricetes sp.]
MDSKKEIRNTSYEVTVDSESRTVEGYALLFDTPSTGLPFVEVIERGSLEGVVAKSDVFALLNHDQSRGILARSKKGHGSLSLTVDAKGLKYRFEAPNTALGNELLENLKRGEVDSSSFAFTVEKDTWERGKDGKVKRTIQKVSELYDVSPVYNAAYSQTSVYKRGMEALEEEERQANEMALNTYFADIENKFN